MLRPDKQTVNTMKNIKTIEQLEKRLSDLERMYFEKFHQKTVEAVLMFLDHNPTGGEPSPKIERIVDNVCLHAAWIYDRIQDKTCTHHSPDYRRSLTKKIRKALGFTF